MIPPFIVVLFLCVLVMVFTFPSMMIGSELLVAWLKRQGMQGPRWLQLTAWGVGFFLLFSTLLRFAINRMFRRHKGGVLGLNVWIVVAATTASALLGLLGEIMMAWIVPWSVVPALLAAIFLPVNVCHKLLTHFVSDFKTSLANFGDRPW